ncbi:hypothetical protein BRW62_10985 [Parathermosynechococcus lividus PCC 6715]|uniref:DM13 domain-containing protein n=1 Tax=Parathermosynechococcus lividus PCC 6715 TaxID=1917166 RepID=A0A2D2Q543_PARLV|nr:DM13 domain-containing protein [Thermostichus lividus]ATS19626.1 hypothetical protein BRW62_10985 [Thermostichus lividus PCC 6715]
MLLKRFLLLGVPLALTAACTSHPAAEVRADSAPTTPLEAGSDAASVTIKSGNFMSGEHPTSGIAKIFNNSGQLVLELDQSFETSPMGPDLVVVLHRSENVLGSTTPPAFPLREGDYVILAELQSFSGDQRYDIPATVNLDEYRSVAIWCRRFNATFGAAALQ